MTLLKVRPRSTRTFSNGFNAVLDELLKDQKTSVENTADFVPRANILEHEQAFEIQVELAGYSKKDVNLNLEKDLLTISGSRKDDNETGRTSVHLKQIREGSFERSFYLPEDILADKINAKLENGILLIHIPKDEKKLVKKSVNID